MNAFDGPAFSPTSKEDSNFFIKENFRILLHNLYVQNVCMPLNKFSPVFAVYGDLVDAEEDFGENFDPCFFRLGFCLIFWTSVACNLKYMSDACYGVPPKSVI